MVGSKGSVKKVETPCTKYYMVLRSMSKQPSLYTHVNNQNNSATKQANGLSKINMEEEKDSPPVVIRNECIRFPKCKCIVYCVTELLLLFTCVVWVYLVFPYPMHASCTVKWKFGDPCTYTMQKFRSQILNWSSCMNCAPCGSKCFYRLTEPKPNENNVIRATHLAPNLRTGETIKIGFEEINKTCVATGESTSNEWFRIFDYGRNYCNLRNLVTGIGFDKSSGFLELATDAVCTQYNMAVCE